MEVHPPEHPIFTWKQFFIHMADYYRSCRVALAAAKADGSKWRVQLPPMPQPISMMRFNLPSIAVWSTGKESQMVPFIPTSRARLFDRLTYHMDLLRVLRAQFIDLVYQEKDELAIAVGPSVALERVDDIHNVLLTSEQRDRLDRIFTQLEATADASDFWLSAFEDVTRAVTDGTPSLEAEQNARLARASNSPRCRSTALETHPRSGTAWKPAHPSTSASPSPRLGRDEQ